MNAILKGYEHYIFATLSFKSKRVLIELVKRLFDFTSEALLLSRRSKFTIVDIRVLCHRLPKHQKEIDFAQ